jgi:Fe-S-cluster-containing hydrogenase component 2
LCLNECPLQAISQESEDYVIDPEVCTECGSCADICPEGAISGM